MNRALIALFVFLSLAARAADSDKPLISLDGEINDRLIQSTITAQADKWLKAGEATKSEDLVAHLNR